VAAERALRVRAEATVRALAATIDAKDHYTRSHSDDVRAYALLIAQHLQIEPARLERIAIAAELHDIGKIAVPDEILSKRGPLTAAEFEAIKKHSPAGERIIREAGFDEIAPAVRHHHERWDGGGYPDRLHGTEIPLAARIITIADALDAMWSDRPYRPRLTIEQVRTEIVGSAETQFDPQIAQVVLELLDAGLIREPPARHPRSLCGWDAQPKTGRREMGGSTAAPTGSKNKLILAAEGREPHPRGAGDRGRQTASVLAHTASAAVAEARRMNAAELLGAGHPLARGNGCDTTSGGNRT
jgi:hypothetical protein